MALIAIGMEVNKSILYEIMAKTFSRTGFYCPECGEGVSDPVRKFTHTAVVR